MVRNLTDNTAPTTDELLDPWCFTKFYRGNLTVNEYDTDGQKNKTGAWQEINISDMNNSHIGHWLTYKCLASSNIGLRSEDPNNVEEYALMGNPRSFAPKKHSLKSSEKIDESKLFNLGYGATVGVRQNFKWNDVPYTRDVFDTRIMFSNVQENNSFKNAYRIFQGLSYQDVDNQYGSITKILE